jgi:dihydroorotate dehydrogenase (fumarate)
MRLPLRWIAMLYGRVRASLAATSGVHHGNDALKLILAGADVTMLCTVLLQRGITHITTIESELRDAMQKHGYDSVAQIRGTLGQKNSADPGAFERAQYIRAVAKEKSTPRIV